MSTGKLIILSAPSGTGKTTICKKLLEKNKDWKFSVSATTRPKRENEEDGDDYIFMSVDKFEHYVKFGDFLEWEWVHGNKYGTLISSLEDALDNNEIMLLDIDVKGGTTIMEEFPDETISIFIEPPGEDIPEQLEILENRLKSRANDSSTLIKQRLKRFQVEIEYKEKFKFHFVNDNIEITTDKILETIRKELG
jgi:guanylate kinase